MDLENYKIISYFSFIFIFRILLYYYLVLYVETNLHLAASCRLYVSVFRVFSSLSSLFFLPVLFTLKEFQNQYLFWLQKVSDGQTLCTYLLYLPVNYLSVSLLRSLLHHTFSYLCLDLISLVLQFCICLLSTNLCFYLQVHVL